MPDGWGSPSGLELSHWYHVTKILFSGLCFSLENLNSLTAWKLCEDSKWQVPFVAPNSKWILVLFCKARLTYLNSESSFGRNTVRPSAGNTRSDHNIRIFRPSTRCSAANSRPVLLPFRDTNLVTFYRYVLCIRIKFKRANFLNNRCYLIWIIACYVGLLRDYITSIMNLTNVHPLTYAYFTNMISSYPPNTVFVTCKVL